MLVGQAQSTDRRDDDAPSATAVVVVAVIRRFVAGDACVAGVVAALVSGVPSTIHALWRGDDLLEASLAAGTLLLPREERRGPLLVAAGAAHAGLSLGWSLVLERLLPARATLRWSAVGGLAIAALDLGVVGRRLPRIRALPLLPQVADHLAFALTVGAVVRRRRAARTRRHRPISAVATGVLAALARGGAR